MKWLKNVFSKITPCVHIWEDAMIHQVRIEDGKLIPFMMRTSQLKKWVNIPIYTQRVAKILNGTAQGNSVDCIFS